VLPRVTAQDQPAATLLNQADQIKQLSSIELPGFINDYDRAFC
jgi:hypothetical protein